MNLGPPRGLIRARHLAAPVVVLLIAVLCVAVALPPIAGAAEPGTSAPTEAGATEGGEEGGGGLVGSTQRPQLLLIHGGSFLFEDPEFEPLTRAPALAARRSSSVNRAATERSPCRCTCG